jgi:hypothetical protein
MLGNILFLVGLLITMCHLSCTLVWLNKPLQVPPKAIGSAVCTQPIFFWGLMGIDRSFSALLRSQVRRSL